MKTIRSAVMLAAIAAVSTSALAQSQQKIKAGDKISSEIITYGTKGREVIVESTRPIDVSITQTDSTYTLSSDAGRTVYQRSGHVVIERESSAGKVVVAENQRFNWMPPGGDWGKPYSGSFQIHNPNCGLGKMTFDATAKPAKFTLLIGGKATELDVQEVQIAAKWMLAGNCGSGTQPMKIVYAPDLDIAVERDTKVFGVNGLLIRGDLFKIKALN